MIAKKRNLRRVLAVGFLVLLLVEWGSHSVIDAHTSSTDAPSISAHDGGHGDLCNTLILCSDSGRRDTQNSNLGREVQHAPPLDLLSAVDARFLVRQSAPIDFVAGDAIFRPPCPPFHPPETS